MHLVIDDQVARHQLLCRAVGRCVATIDRGMAGPNCQHHRKIVYSETECQRLQFAFGQGDLMRQRRRHSVNPLSTPMTGGATHRLETCSRVRSGSSA